MSQDPYLMPGTKNRMINELYRYPEYCRMCGHEYVKSEGCNFCVYECDEEVLDAE